MVNGLGDNFKKNTIHQLGELTLGRSTQAAEEERDITNNSFIKSTDKDIDADFNDNNEIIDRNGKENNTTIQNTFSQFGVPDSDYTELKKLIDEYILSALEFKKDSGRSIYNPLEKETENNQKNITKTFQLSNGNSYLVSMDNNGNISNIKETSIYGDDTTETKDNRRLPLHLEIWEEIMSVPLFNGIVKALGLNEDGSVANSSTSEVSNHKIDGFNIPRSDGAQLQKLIDEWVEEKPSEQIKTFNVNNRKYEAIINTEGKLISLVEIDGQGNPVVQTGNNNLSEFGCIETDDLGVLTAQFHSELKSAISRNTNEGGYFKYEINGHKYSILVGNDNEIVNVTRNDDTNAYSKYSNIVNAEDWSTLYEDASDRFAQLWNQYNNLKRVQAGENMGDGKDEDYWENQINNYQTSKEITCTSGASYKYNFGNDLPPSMTNLAISKISESRTIRIDKRIQ